MEKAWHYAKDGKQLGPVSQEQLLKLIQEGTVAAEDLVWTNGMANWLPASEVSEFQQAFRSPAAQTVAPAAAPVVVPVTLQYAGPSMEAFMVSARSLDMLKATRPWVRLISILLFIGAGFLLIAGVAMVFATAVGGRMGETFFFGLVYFAVSPFYIAPAVYLWQYASRIGALLADRRSDLLDSALQAQKSFWKFVGIFITVVIGFYVISIVIALVAIAFL